MITITQPITFHRDRQGRGRLTVDPPAPKVACEPRIPRIAKLMALAIHFQQLIRQGQVTDMSELARLAHVTQPRITQIMNLNHLAPDIQEELLFLTHAPASRQLIHEKRLRPIAAHIDWHQQRAMWRQLRDADASLQAPPP